MALWQTKIRGRRVLVTGASSGVGEATAKKLAVAGAVLILVARREDELHRVMRELPAGSAPAASYVCDLSDQAAIDALCDKVLAEQGPVDVLINNAGRSIRRSIFASFDRFHDFERTMQLNYFAPVKLTLRLMPGMLERGHGRVINISTMSTLLTVPRFSAYVGSKSALDGFSRSVDAEVRGKGVRVCTVHLSLVRTPMIAPTQAYKKVKTLSPEGAAELVCEALTTSSPQVRTLAGRLVHMQSSALPRLTAKAGQLMFKQMMSKDEKELIAEATRRR